MKFLRNLKQKLEENRAATKDSMSKLVEAHRTDPIVDREHLEALSKLQEASQMANRLNKQDLDNHYSESLAIAFRGGRTAQ